MTSSWTTHKPPTARKIYRGEKAKNKSACEFGPVLPEVITQTDFRNFSERTLLIALHHIFSFQQSTFLLYYSWSKPSRHYRPSFFLKVSYLAAYWAPSWALSFSVVASYSSFLSLEASRHHQDTGMSRVGTVPESKGGTFIKFGLLDFWKAWCFFNWWSFLEPYFKTIRSIVNCFFTVGKYM